MTKLRARDGALLKTLSMCNPYTFAFDGAPSLGYKYRLSSG